jgi:hypothetical protein
MNTPNNQQSLLRRGVPTLLAIISGVVLCCALVLVALIGYNLFFPTARASVPLVLIHSPQHGAQLGVGEITTIHAVARDEENITRVELWVDDELEEVQTSSLQGGITPFPMLVEWQPLTTGTHTLAVRAFNSQGSRAHGSIEVEAIASDDRDGDGIEDTLDTCPDEPGPASPDGCPIPGDADGDEVPDADDACPDEPGLLDDEGCPDRDGDGVPDHLDEDPDEPGPADTDGAPDTDGDGVPDDEDLSPEDPGPADAGGAPESGAGDRDGDGAPDDVDPCPDDAGAPEDGFCPPPGDDPGDPADPPSLFDDPGGVFSGDREIPVLLEIEAYEFSVSGDYHDVWCYVQLGDSDMERYEFEPQGEQFWNIAEVLSGDNSVHLTSFLGESLSVFVECWAGTSYFYTEEGGGGIPEGGGSGTVYDLGSFTTMHESEDWGGRELLADGTGPGGEAFRAKYRICSPSCDEAAIQPPILYNVTFGPLGEGPFLLDWRWDGNEDMIDGFALSVNGTFPEDYRTLPPDERSTDISQLMPSCGQVLDLSIYVYGIDSATGTSWWSPPSNTVIWNGDSCPRTVLVTFGALDTGALRSRKGPIYGTFMVNDVPLLASGRSGTPSFRALDDTERYLNPGNFYWIASLFSNIETEALSCPTCTSNFAPAVNYVEVELGHRESLTFGAIISEEGRYGAVFNAFRSIRPDRLTPGYYSISDNGIILIVTIDVLVGPEAGINPDLVVQEVVMDEGSGQPQIRVFNNAADLVDEEVAINLVRMQTDEDLGTVRSTVTIPSGSSALIPTHMDIEPYDLRLTLDPENTIAEGEDGELNNVYETPVRLRVEFIRIGNHGGPCENWGDRVAEFRFRMKVGHRPPGGAVNWFHLRRYPWTGTVDLNYREDDWDEWENESWPLAGDPFFIFEFDMPAEDDLIIWADGHEDDVGLGADDYMGTVRVAFDREDNYGSRDENHGAVSSGYISCGDGGTSLGWGGSDSGFRVTWNITRIH